ncbi:putative retrieval of early ER protein Rer1 [Helianthus anomalus]
MQTIESTVRDTSDCVRNSYQQGLIGSVVSGIHISTTATPTTDAATSSDALHSTNTPAAAKSTPLLLYRWIVFCLITIIYTARVLYLQGFYVVDLEFRDLSGGPVLPNRSFDEFCPFVPLR